MQSNLRRCEWAQRSEHERHYHDTEWGVPVVDDRTLFEYLILEGAQAGLSWSLILKRREAYRKAFDGFDVPTVSGYTDSDLSRLLADPGIIRNRLKVAAAVKNAAAFLRVREEFGSFHRYLKGFIPQGRIINSWKEVKEIPATVALSDALSRDLKKRGFSFVGSSICYSFMQATGMVNDHVAGCFRYDKINAHSGWD